MIKRWLTENITIKILALALAVIVWLYINSDLIRFNP